MTILFYTNDLRVGGAQRVISILASQFALSGHKTAIFLYSQHTMQAYPIHPDVEVRFLDNHFRLSHPYRNFKELRRTRKHILSLHPDVVITFYAKDTVMAYLALTGLNIPIIYSQRCDPYSAPIKERLYTPIATSIAYQIVFQSAQARDYYSKKVQSKSCIIMNPFVLRDFIPSDIHPRKKVIVSVGRLSDQKNFQLLIEAFHLLKEKLNGYQLHIYGNGTLRESLENLINRLGMQHDVILKGNVPDVITRISCASLFVLPSKFEGIPNALIEAMCIGLPCISTDWSPRGAVRELISHGENGIIVPKETPICLFHAMLEILTNKDTAEKLGFEATKIAPKVEASYIASLWLNLIKQTCL